MSRSTTFKTDNPVYVHQFTEPFKAMAETVDELPIRKPTGLDLLEVGTPVVYDSATGKAELDIGKCYEMTGRLSGMPTKILLGIDTAEMLDFFWMMSSLFMKGRQTFLPALEKQKAELPEQPASPAPSPGASTPAATP